MTLYYSLPFKGKARVGMGVLQISDATLIPTFPLQWGRISRGKF